MPFIISVTQSSSFASLWRRVGGEACSQGRKFEDAAWSVCFGLDNTVTEEAFSQGLKNSPLNLDGAWLPKQDSSLPSPGDSSDEFLTSKRVCRGGPHKSKEVERGVVDVARRKWQEPRQGGCRDAHLAGGRTAAEQSKSGPLAGKVGEKKGGLADGRLKMAEETMRRSRYYEHLVRLIHADHRQFHLPKPLHLGQNCNNLSSSFSDRVQTSANIDTTRDTHLIIILHRIWWRYMYR